MLEDQVAYVLQRYLGDYVRGINKEALKISAWRGDVELTNMQLKPEALNALKLPIKVKAGFLGSVKLKVPWNRLGQEPVLVSLDQILILAEPSTHVEGCTEDAIREAKKSRVREMEIKLLESQQQLKSDVGSSWLGSLISTIIGNLKLSITNVHIRYEDIESNPGHPFAAGMTLQRLSAITVDDSGRETFATGGALDLIQKSVELECLAFYWDSNVPPWSIPKAWSDLLPSEWIQIFEVRGSDCEHPRKTHSYILQPVTGHARYTKLQSGEVRTNGQPLQKAAVNLDDVTLCLSKDGYRDILKLADNFTSFNQRLKYAHYRPSVPVKTDPKSWWKYAYKAKVDEMKKASGKFSWDQVLRYAKLRKRYVTLYASLLKSDVNRMVVDDNEEIVKLDHDLDIEVILQWRLLAHKFVEQSTESDVNYSKQKTGRSWWSFGWGSPDTNGTEPGRFTEEDWEQLYKIIGYKEGSVEQLLPSQNKDQLLSLFQIYMKHNASKLIVDGYMCLADLSCDGMEVSIELYPESKVFDMKLGSYRLLSSSGTLVESATVTESLVGIFSYKPSGTEMDWSLVAKASPCYMTYLKDSVDQIIDFFKSSSAISQIMALETAAAVQMTIEGVRRTAQQQVTKALKDHARFLLDLDVAAPKITIPTNFFPDNTHATKLLLDLGNLIISTQDYWDEDSYDEKDKYLQFNVVLSDVSAFLVDGDYSWSQRNNLSSSVQLSYDRLLPVIDKCGIVLKLQQIQSEYPSYPSTRISARLPSLVFYMSPARYHRLLEIANIFLDERDENPSVVCPWMQADLEGWASVLSWKGVGNREAIWQRRYLCLVGPFLYVLDTPASKTYKHCVSLRGKQVHEVPLELTGNLDHVLAVCDTSQPNTKIIEDANALILLFEADDLCRTWQQRLQGTIYRASGSAAITSLSDISPSLEREKNDTQGTDSFSDLVKQKIFITGVLDELKICFSFSHQRNQNFKAILLSKESRLFEFRAIGGQIEVSMVENDLFLGTLLKSLEIEDLYKCEGSTKPSYIARSFINNCDDNNATTFLSASTENQTSEFNELALNDSEEQFFEAAESLGDMVDSAGHSVVQGPSSSLRLSMKPPSFGRTPGLLPDAQLHVNDLNVKAVATLNSFVKAQVVLYHQDSRLYCNIDKQIIVTLATLSFFCHRPTILAILEFVNALNYEEERSDSHSGKTSATKLNTSDVDETDKADNDNIKKPIAKSLLGKGKSRVVFNVTLEMAQAQIFLVNENGAYLASLSQNNLLADIKVFPSSFSIKAALGNLKISDDSLPSNHAYFWVCDMRNPGGSSFVELVFSSFSTEDDDYCGYDYSLDGQLSEVRIIYLNRFIQEVFSYFMGLVPSSSKSIVKLKDQVSDSEKWFTTTEIDGSPALKLDVSLSRPIILMPRRTDSHDFLELDVLHITVRNSFQWLGGYKNEINAVHMETMIIQVKEINLVVGMGNVTGESIIEDVNGLSIVIRRSLRDLLHQIPAIEAVIKVEELKAALSSREYEIISECSVSNISEPPHTIPTFDLGFEDASQDISEQRASLASEAVEIHPQESAAWITMKVSVDVNLVELHLHSGTTRESPLATVQANGAWLLYKTNSFGENFLWATVKGFMVMDDREGTQYEFRHAIKKNEDIGYLPLSFCSSQPLSDCVQKRVVEEHDIGAALTMLILDVKFKQSSISISLCIQRPHLLVALDFLLATAEFFVPRVRTLLSDEGDEDPVDLYGAIILDSPYFVQPSFDFFLSPQKPLIVDDERFHHYIYDGKGGNLYLQGSRGMAISSCINETVIFVGDGKRLQFKNVSIQNGNYLDSCIYLGSDSSYSASEVDNVFLEKGNESVTGNSTDERTGGRSSPIYANSSSAEMEYLVELQAVGPELVFYNTSKGVDESLSLSNKLLHMELDVFCRLMLKGDTTEITGNMLGLKVESNGIRILEPFDTSLNFSSVAGKTNISLSISEVYMNFSFSILRLFLAVEEDILAFVRMTSKKASVTCSQFDKVGTVGSESQRYTFWRPCAPPGFAVLADCLTPLDLPPSRGVLAVNMSFIRVKRPISYKLIWTTFNMTDSSKCQDSNETKNFFAIGTSISVDGSAAPACSIWFPLAPAGYVAVGCVVSTGTVQPPLSAGLCILASLVSACSLKDCISLPLNESCHAVAFWRVDNSFGSFLPSDPSTMRALSSAYELRQLFFGGSVWSSKLPKDTTLQENPLDQHHGDKIQRSALPSSGRVFETVASFRLIWWNQGSSGRKKLSIWRPVVPNGMVYFGDIAVQGYEPPNACYVLRDVGYDGLVKPPLDFHLVGEIKKQKRIDSINFWLPQAPPGFVSLGCIACRSSPKNEDFSSLRCIRSDMVTGDQFPEESMWDTSDIKVSKEPFSIWIIDDEVGTFVVRRGFKKPPKRFALKLADTRASNNLDNIIVDAEIKRFSAAVYDDYGGLMVPLFNISFTGVGFSLRGRPNYMASTVNFSLIGRSYNDKYDSWEPLIEPMDGYLRYLYDMNSPGVISQIRMASVRDVNLNISASNINMFLQAYSSWNNLSHVHQMYKKRETVSPSNGGKSLIGIPHKTDYYIIPQNKLGQDIFVRANEIDKYSTIMKMPSGDTKPVKVPMSRNMLDSHLVGNTHSISRSMLAVIISSVELVAAERLSRGQCVVAVRLYPNQINMSMTHQQSARTCGAALEHSSSSGHCSVVWDEMFFFKVDYVDNYTLEFIVIDLGRGEPIGFYSSPLAKMVYRSQSGSDLCDINSKLNWRELFGAKSKASQNIENAELLGRISFAVILPEKSENQDDKQFASRKRRPGFLQISPTRGGPWTTVRLNYAAPAACWRLGSGVVASELTVKNGTRYVNIRSLVSVNNNTDFSMDICLKCVKHDEKLKSVDDGHECAERNDEISIYETDEFFEIEKYIPSLGWVSISQQMPVVQQPSDDGSSSQWVGNFLQISESVPHSSNGIIQKIGDIQLPSGWEWIDDWHIDMSSVNKAEGWVYAPDLEDLRWPESFPDKNSTNHVRERRWVRHRKCILCEERNQIELGTLKPGDTMSLPLQAIVHPVLLYFLQLRPKSDEDLEFCWSTATARHRGATASADTEDDSEIFVSSLAESEIALHCSQISRESPNITFGLWFCLSIRAIEIGKDIHSDPIYDWKIIINSPLSISNYLPLPAEYSILTKHSNGQFITSFQRILLPGETVKVYSFDLEDYLYLSLTLTGWDLMHGPVLISHSNELPSKTANLKSAFSGRVVQIIIEQNLVKENLIACHLRVYAPYWIASARCPPLTYRFLDISEKKRKGQHSTALNCKNDDKVMWQIGQEEMWEGRTIASAIIFKHFGLSVSIGGHGKEFFGVMKDLSSLGDMDGSLDLCAYDADGNCIRIFLSTKPCPYPNVPTKVIFVRPFTAFTNRLGQDLFLKFSGDDQSKVLHAFDSRVSFICQDAGLSDKIQVRLEDTAWSFPFEIVEDTITVLLRKNDGGRRLLKSEIRGYEEGSRFIVVFRLRSSSGPIRIENRIPGKKISIRQSGLDDSSWIHLEPLSTTNFCWENPHGKRLLDVYVHNEIEHIIKDVSLEKISDSEMELRAHGVQLNRFEVGDNKIARFTSIQNLSECLNEETGSLSVGWRDTLHVQNEAQSNTVPTEVIIELGVVGVSLIDHKPRELLFLYLERVFVSYSTGYDAGTTSRFKLIVGQVQLDNQLPLTAMPVLLAPEDIGDICHPVFKTTITMSCESLDGTQVYPYVYVRVTDKCWRINIHEPIIWSLMDLYSNLHLDRLSSSSAVTQVDPEIRIDLIDISEIRLKLSLETAPIQRPHGVLGIWGPILSAVGNALKIQVHLRKVMHRNRFLRRSAIIPSIFNRIKRDLIHDPLHLIFSVDVLGMTRSTFASLSKGFAELSTDGQFLQLRSKQVWSRRITGVSDGILQGTEALAQGVVFGVSGVVRKPVESARQHGLLGLAHGLGRAFLGFIVQPVSGALDFVSLTVDGISASFTRCLELLGNKASVQRIRNPRAIHANGILREYSEREALGQMILYLAEASRHLGCTDLFKEPSKYAWSDYYEDHFMTTYHRILLVTNRRVLLLQCLAPDKMDKRPCKIIWDIPWEELMALELAKAGYPKPSHLIIHLKTFRRSESFVRVVNCSIEEDEGEEPQAVRICSAVRKMWKAHQSDMKTLTLKVPSSQRYVYFASDETEGQDTTGRTKLVLKPSDLNSSQSKNKNGKFVMHCVNFLKIWSSELESKNRCTLCPKQVRDDNATCSIWRPLCPDGYVSVGDIARIGVHPPNVASIYQDFEGLVASPLGYDLVWRNCADDYVAPFSVWHPRAPEGFVSLGCVGVAGFEEPHPDSAYCVSAQIAEETIFEDQTLWSAPDSYPWACYFYQVNSEALQFVALRQPKEESDWKPRRVSDNTFQQLKGTEKGRENQMGDSSRG